MAVMQLLMKTQSVETVVGAWERIEYVDHYQIQGMLQKSLYVNPQHGE